MVSNEPLLLISFQPTTLACGSSNLNDDQMAEWGYIDMREIFELGK
jgi:hypothetical protein